MPGDWSSEEVAAAVTDYLDMLEAELRGEPYNKAEHRRALQRMLQGRTEAAIERKHQNISAVLLRLGFPYINGYKPLSNYQAALHDEVLARLEGHADLLAVARVAVIAPADVAPIDHRTIQDIIVPPPERSPTHDRGQIYERGPSLPPMPVRIDYLERESRNASLGRAGEEFVLAVEHKRLWEAGRRQFAERIEHVSDSRGDGLGYDILSFEVDGRDKLIEVKTTAFGSMTPFFASDREVAVSDEHAPSFDLYRVYDFRRDPRLFVLHGSLRENVLLDPVQYRGRLR